MHASVTVLYAQPTTSKLSKSLQLTPATNFKLPDSHRQAYNMSPQMCTVVVSRIHTFTDALTCTDQKRTLLFVCLNFLHPVVFNGPFTKNWVFVVIAIQKVESYGTCLVKSVVSLPAKPLFPGTNLELFTSCKLTLYSDCEPLHLFYFYFDRLRSIVHNLPIA
jgi:hypothetical protein